MTNEEKEKLLTKITALGFTPFNHPSENEFALNPGKIEPPAEIKTDEWLTVNDCEAVAEKSDRTIYRWQTDYAFINCTILAEGKDRSEARHYILKSDFLDFLQKVRQQRVIYVSKEPMTRMSEDMSEEMTETNVKRLSESTTNRQARQEVFNLDPEAKEKMLALPDELGKKLQSVLEQALSKQKEEILKEIPRLDQIFTKQLEYKEKEIEEREGLKGRLSRLAITNTIAFIIIIATATSIFIWQNNKAILERETLKNKLTSEYSEKINSELITLKKDLTEDYSKKISDITTGVKTNLENLNESVKAVSSSLGSVKKKLKIDDEQVEDNLGLEEKNK